MQNCKLLVYKSICGPKVYFKVVIIKKKIENTIWNTQRQNFILKNQKENKFGF